MVDIFNLSWTNLYLLKMKKKFLIVILILGFLSFLGLILKENIKKKAENSLPVVQKQKQTPSSYQIKNVPYYSEKNFAMVPQQ